MHAIEFSPELLARYSAPYQPNGYRQYGFVELFTPDGYNPKTKKGRARGYSTAILHFAPANLSGMDVCQFRTPGCTAACLNTAGHGGIGIAGVALADIGTVATNEIQAARIARTYLYRYGRFNFNAMLVRAIETHCRRAHRKGLTPVVRLNGTSDLPWERMRLNDGRTVLETFPDIQFYDYTKDVRRALKWARGQMPVNYHLTFSRAETNSADAQLVLAAGGNVAAVVNVPVKKGKRPAGPMPATLFGTPVVDGDVDDLRFLDPKGVIVGLRAKGRAQGDTSGFVVDVLSPRGEDAINWTALERLDAWQTDYADMEVRS